jgi:hypothetical protein
MSRKRTVTIKRPVGEWYPVVIGRDVQTHNILWPSGPVAQVIEWHPGDVSWTLCPSSEEWHIFLAKGKATTVEAAKDAVRDAYVAHINETLDAAQRTDR